MSGAFWTVYFYIFPPLQDARGYPCYVVQGEARPARDAGPSQPRSVRAEPPLGPGLSQGTAAGAEQRSRL